MFTHDACAVEIREALIDACNRGVAVTLLVDAFGSSFTPDSFFRPLRDAGARFGRFGKHRSTRYRSAITRKWRSRTAVAQ